MKSQKQTKAQIIQEQQRRIKELEAGRIMNKSMAYNALKKFGEPCFGSAVIITIECLGGKLKIDPFAISDGLSNETILALKADIKRSIDLTINHPINTLNN